MQFLFTKLFCLFFQKTDVTVLDARVVNTCSSEEDKENIVPSESEVLQTTINRLQNDLQELRTSAAEKDNEISRLSVQNNEAEAEIQSLVSSFCVNYGVVLNIKTIFAQVILDILLCST